MPRTPPPLILPTNLPSNWINRSKVNKKRNDTSNIYAAQNKQISFNDVDEYHFIPPFNMAESSATDSNDVTSSIIAIDRMQTRTMSASVSTNQNSFTNVLQQAQQQQQQQQEQQQQQRQDQNTSSQQNPKSPNTQNTLPPLSSYNSSTENTKKQLKHTTATDLSPALEQANHILEHKSSAKDFLTPSSQQFESLILISQELASDFQKFMEEYRDIKKSIEDKKKELIEYTEERLQYLAQRQARFYHQVKSLQEFI